MGSYATRTARNGAKKSTEEEEMNSKSFSN